MMTRTDGELLYLDDIQVGQKFGSASHAVDAVQIKAFARQFDPQPFHLDELAAHKVCLVDLPQADGIPQLSPCDY